MVGQADQLGYRRTIECRACMERPLAIGRDIVRVGSGLTARRDALWRPRTIKTRSVQIFSYRVVGRRDEIEPFARVIRPDLGYHVARKVRNELRVAVVAGDHVGMAPTIALTK